MKKLFPLMALASAMFLSACGLNKGAQTLDVKTKEEAQAYLVEKLTGTVKAGAKATIDAAATIEADEGEFDLRLGGYALIGKGFTENYAKLTLDVDGEVEREIEPEEDDDEETPPTTEAGETDGEAGESEGEDESTVIVPQTETVQLKDKVTLEGYLFKNKPALHPMATGDTSEGTTSEETSRPIELKETYSLYGKLSDEHGILYNMIPILFDLNEAGYTEPVYLNDDDIEFDDADINNLGAALAEENILPNDYKVDGMALTVEYNIPVQDDIIIPLQFTVKGDDITVKVPETRFTYIEKDDDDEAETTEGETTLLTAEGEEEEEEPTEIKVVLEATATLKKGGQEELALKVATFNVDDWTKPEEEPAGDEGGEAQPLQE